MPRKLEKAKENHRKALGQKAVEAASKKGARLAETGMAPILAGTSSASPQVSLDGVTLHVLRHTFASLLIGQGS